MNGVPGVTVAGVSHLGEFAALATACLWTISALAWTSAGRQLGSLSVNFLRLLLTIGLLMIYGKLVRGFWFPSDASVRTWLLMGLSGFVGFFLADLCFMKALLLIGPRLTLLMQSLSPPIAAILSAVFLADRLTQKDWLGMAVTLAGVTWVVLERRGPGPEPVDRQALWLGVALAALAAVGQAAGLVLSKQGLGDYDAAAATFIRVIGSMVGFVVLLSALRHWSAVAAACRQARPMAILSVGAVVGPFAGVILCMVAVRHTNPGVAATILSTMPVLILPAVILVYREQVSLRAVVGAAVSVAGVALLMIY